MLDGLFQPLHVLTAMIAALFQVGPALLALWLLFRMSRALDRSAGAQERIADALEKRLPAS